MAGLLTLNWDEVHGITERAVQRALGRREDFVAELRQTNVTPHLAQNGSGTRRSGIARHGTLTRRGRPTAVQSRRRVLRLTEDGRQLAENQVSRAVALVLRRNFLYVVDNDHIQRDILDFD
jgi:hypothetical protein